MSGRLVILRHKSWNVWNQDNREKVLRDERLHREEQEQNVDKKRNTKLEQNYLQLRNQNQSEGDDTSTSAFQLLSDRPQKEANSDYVNEQAEKQRKKRKYDGLEKSD
jgi:hypothetical protein